MAKPSKPIRQIGDALIELLTASESVLDKGESFFGVSISNMPATALLISDIKKDTTIQRHLNTCIFQSFFRCEGPTVESHIVSKSQLNKLSLFDSNSQAYSAYIGAPTLTSDQCKIQKREWNSKGPTLRLFCSNCEYLFGCGSLSPIGGHCGIPAFPEFNDVSIDSPNLYDIVENCNNLSLDFPLKYPHPKKLKENVDMQWVNCADSKLISMYVFYLKYQLRAFSYYARISQIQTLMYAYISKKSIAYQTELLKEWGLASSYDFEDEMSSEIQTLANFFGILLLDANYSYFMHMQNLSSIIARFGSYTSFQDLSCFYTSPIFHDTNKHQSSCLKWISKKVVTKENFEKISVFSGILPISPQDGDCRHCLIGWLEIDPLNNDQLIQYFGAFGMYNQKFIVNNRTSLSYPSNKKIYQDQIIMGSVSHLCLAIGSQIKGGLGFTPFFGNNFFVTNFIKIHNSVFGENSYLFNDKSIEVIANKKFNSPLLFGELGYSVEHEIKMKQDFEKFGKTILDLMVDKFTP